MHKYSQTPTAHIPVSPPAQLSPKPSPKPSEDLYIAVLASHQERFSPQPSPSTEPLSQIRQVRLIWQCISVYFCMFLILSFFGVNCAFSEVTVVVSCWAVTALDHLQKGLLENLQKN